MYFQKLIRAADECIYFFLKFCLHLASDIFFYLLNVGLRRITGDFRSDSFFQYIVLRKFSHD